MVRQGDIVKLELSPTVGHEQTGYRPVVVVSGNYALSKTNMVFVAPITNTNRQFPLHVTLDCRTKTTGMILCEHVRAVDMNSRQYAFIEKLPDDLLNKALSRIIACFDT